MATSIIPHERTLTMELIASLFEKALKLESPWQVKRIELIEGRKILTIFKRWSGLFGQETGVYKWETALGS